MSKAITKECGIVMIPTKDKSDIIYDPLRQNSICFNDSKYEKLIKFDLEYQHLYITSDDEIKEGEHCIHLATNQVIKYPVGGFPKGHSKKIIATTDESLTVKHPEVCNINLPQIPQSFIKEYCEQGGIDKVLVEYYFKGERCSLCGFSRESGECIDKKDCVETYFGGELMPKTYSNNTITIKPVKERMYSRAEVIQMFWDCHNGVLDEDKLNWLKEKL